MELARRAIYEPERAKGDFTCGNDQQNDTLALLGLLSNAGVRAMAMCLGSKL